jgi:hypothetical protein
VAHNSASHAKAANTETAARVPVTAVARRRIVVLDVSPGLGLAIHPLRLWQRFLRMERVVVRRGIHVLGQSTEAVVVSMGIVGVQTRTVGLGVRVGLVLVLASPGR